MKLYVLLIVLLCVGSLLCGLYYPWPTLPPVRGL